MNANNTVASIDNEGEFPRKGSPSDYSWRDVYAKIDNLLAGGSHIRILVKDYETARKLVSSCFRRTRRTMLYSIETRTAPSEDGYYVYIRKIDKKLKWD